MKSNPNPTARSAADYAIGFADHITRAQYALTPDERHESEIKAMTNLALLGRDAAVLKKQLPEADAEARARIRDLQEVA